jgi:hypothetical protein
MLPNWRAFLVGLLHSLAGAANIAADKLQQLRAASSAAAEVSIEPSASSSSASGSADAALRLGLAVLVVFDNLLVAWPGRVMMWLYASCLRDACCQVNMGGSAA